MAPDWYAFLILLVPPVVSISFLVYRLKPSSRKNNSSYSSNVSHPFHTDQNPSQNISKPSDKLTDYIKENISASAPPPVEPVIHSSCSVSATPVSSPAPKSVPVPSSNPHIFDQYARYGGWESQLLSIDLMDGLDFEQWCAAALRDLGYTNVVVTPASGDQGVDVLAIKDSVRYAFQCKRYASPLGNAPIQEVHSGKEFYHCHVGVVITNQLFTKDAVTLANATGTLLWDRNWIIGYLKSKDYSSSPSFSVSQPVLHSDPDDDYTQEMFVASVNTVLETGQASISMIQRRLKLGYARAARIMDEMEEKGIVGPLQNSKPRQILISAEQWETMQREFRNT